MYFLYGMPSPVDLTTKALSNSSTGPSGAAGQGYALTAREYATSLVRPFFFGSTSNTPAPTSEQDAPLIQEPALASSGPPTSIGASPNGIYFFSLSDHAISLWKARPTALIGQLSRSSLTSPFTQGVWSPTGSVLAIATLNGDIEFIHLYPPSVDTEEDEAQPLLQFGFGDSQFPHISGPGEGAPGIPAYRMRPVQGISLPAGAIITQMAGSSEGVWVVMSDGRFHLIPWPGMATTRWSASFMDIPLLSDILGQSWSPDTSDSAPIQDLVWDADRGCLGLTLVSGDALLLTPAAAGRPWSSYILHRPIERKDKATRVSINHLMGVIAVGTQSGRVHLYRLDPPMSPPSFSTSHFHTIPSPRRPSGAEIDGLALAVGRQGGPSGGLALYGAFGRIFADSSSEPLFADGLEGISFAPTVDGEGHGVSEGLVEPFHDGVTTIFWGQGDAELFIWPSEDQAQLFTLGTLASADAKCPTHDNAKNALLISWNGWIVYTGAAGDKREATAAEGDSPEALRKEVAWPTLYISENWPVRYASMSEDGLCVALAGERGFAHYHGHTRKWKCLQRQDQEQAIRVTGGLAWYNRILVCAIEDLVTQEYSIRFYSRDLPLDEDLRLTEEGPLSAKPLRLNIRGETLVVYCADNVVYHYGLHLNQSGVLDWIGSPSMKGQVVRKDAGDSSGKEMLIDPSLLFPSHPAHLIGLVVAGDLLLIDPHRMDSSTPSSGEGITYMYRRLARGVDTGVYVDLTAQGNDFLASIWAFTPQDALIWPVLNRELQEVDPLEGPGGSSLCGQAALTLRGIVFGAEQRSSHSHTLGCSTYTIATTSQLYLHKMMEHLIQRAGITGEGALMYARVHEKHMYFGHALEILLHHVLEEEADREEKKGEEGERKEESETESGSPTRMLKAVVGFIREFPDFLEVIVRCARKTEVSMWSLLFGSVGEPKLLFEECLERQQLQTATAYLIVLQTLEPTRVNSEDSAKLLEKVVDARDFELCKEIIRFLQSISGSGIDLEQLIAEMRISEI
ncbi:RIC1-domain-containing protein [Piptocephalis cylindrospora]|uniref:RIC1-domain-containing protein n=1 Tax=Piptocephalis cylindrospora TaxID=1907219 RepID=A0A4V1IYC4_9FUNG|nr:RIC1-domain-containing protein [Piptocephalis cylindrospora]|eukprot:RKP14069.1 RIC1-domain-containing protein [Piptocephalis cylindrospora]